MATHWGKVPAGATLPFIFDSYAGSTGASVTLTGLAVTDIEVYKGTSVTQRSSDNGYALIDTDGIDIDGITGIHGFSIDTSDNSDVGFYAVGSFYTVVVSSVTVDSQTVNFVAGTFWLTAAEATAGYPVVDVARISNDATAADNCELMFDGTGYAGGTTKLDVNAASVSNGAITAAAIATGAIDADAIADGAIDAGAFGVGAITTNTFAAGAIDASAIGTNAIDADAIATNAITAASFAADTSTEIANAIWSASPRTLTSPANITSTDGEIPITVGGYVSAQLANATHGGAAAELVLGGASGLTANVTGNVSGSVGSVAAGGITAASIATDAIDADAIKTDAITEIQAGLALEATLTAIKGAGWTTETLAAIDVLIDAIKAKTDNLPASPAAVGSAMTLANGAITADVIATDAIDDDAIANGAIHNTAFTAQAIDVIWDEVVTGATSARDALAAILDDTGTSGVVVASIAAGAIDAAAIATDAIDADAIAADAIDEIVDQAWDETLADHLGAGSTGAGLNAAGAAGDPWSTALPGVYGAGTAGKIVGDNLNATVSSRATQTSVDTVDDFLDTEVAAIKAKTDQLTFTTPNSVDATASVDESAIAVAVAAALTIPSAADIDTQLSGTHGAGSWGTAAGAGAITFTYTVTNSVNGAAIEGVSVWISTDSAGSIVVAGPLTTNASGQVVFYLDAGTYYVWRSLAGWNFTNPDTEVVA